MLTGLSPNSFSNPRNHLPTPCFCSNAIYNVPKRTPQIYRIREPRQANMIKRVCIPYLAIFFQNDKRPQPSRCCRCHNTPKVVNSTSSIANAVHICGLRGRSRDILRFDTKAVSVCFSFRRSSPQSIGRYSFSIDIAKAEPSTVVGCSPYAAAETAAPKWRLVRNEGSCKGIPRNKRPSLVDIKLPYGGYLKTVMVALLKCNDGYIGFLIHALHAVRLQ